MSESKTQENGNYAKNGVGPSDNLVKVKDKKTGKEKLMIFLNALLKPIGLIACLYFFICSLDTMSSSFRLIAGRYAGEFFRSSSVLTNPLAGLMIGVLVTVLVQSSSTSTSIVVSMVASGILEVKFAIPIVMGANIGTSITSALVSLGQVGNRDNFRRAFAGATVHDMFNCLTVLVLLPLEIATGYLNIVTKAIVDSLIKFDFHAKEPELLTALTKPFTSLIIQLDKEVLKNISIGAVADDVEMRKHICGETVKQTTNETVDIEYKKCTYIFQSVKWPEWTIGIILLIFSLITLITCLLFMVKILNSAFQGPVAKLLRKIVNSDLPGPFRYLTGFIAILLGCLLTIIIQSSSVFMSTLTPLVGMGLVDIERVFPLTLGSNIGTTVTGILAAFSASPHTLKYSLQIAFCHSLFNITGILIWYPIPFMRQVPLNIARWLGNTTSKYRWFVLVYLLSVFIIIPVTIFGLSMAGWKVMFAVLGPIVFLLITIGVINLLQNKKPDILPESMKTWNFLPEPLRSLEPYDRLISTYLMCCKCCIIATKEEEAPYSDDEIPMSQVVTTKNENNIKKGNNKSIKEVQVQAYSNEAFTTSF